MRVTRRALLASALLAPMTAYAQTAQPDWLREHPAMAAWTAPTLSPDRFLATRIEPAVGAERVIVRDWLEGRPTVVAVWATWCGPCLSEKRPEAELQTRLTAAGSRAQIKTLLAYDSTRLADAQTQLQALGAGALHSARATEPTEQALLHLFGIRRDRRSMRREDQQLEYLRTTLPFTLLFDANGTLLGQNVGTLVAADRRGSYWRSPTTFDLLQRLGG